MIKKEHKTYYIEVNDNKIGRIFYSIPKITNYIVIYANLNDFLKDYYLNNELTKGLKEKYIVEYD